MMDRFVMMPSMPELPKKKPFFWNTAGPLPEPTRPSRRKPPQKAPKRRPSPPLQRARSSSLNPPSADVEVARAAAAARVRRKRQEDRVRWQQELSEMLQEPQQDEDNEERRPSYGSSSRGVDVADRAAAAAGMQAAAAAAHRAKRFADIARRRASVYARQAATDETVRESPRPRLPPPTKPTPICGGDNNDDDKESDYYSILGVSRRATSIELKKAFFRLALRCHPDRSKCPEATAKMTRLNEAYSCLADPQSRYRYDQALIKH